MDNNGSIREIENWNDLSSLLTNLYSSHTEEVYIYCEVHLSWIIQVITCQKKNKKNRIWQKSGGYKLSAMQ